jgi:hypothetical protein
MIVIVSDHLSVAGFVPSLLNCSVWRLKVWNLQSGPVDEMRLIARCAGWGFGKSRIDSPAIRTVY